ncbi:hypothetical protein PIB30_032650 [Stylosanthes scabra]|uniref:Uncharacterized protein n=1 Tax=Stylosanthes scabra TaxID=79078 RepID=A0ABU6WAK3_9FABA|nr:hypothetical protein [Stylosanthes scabra]
MQLTHEAEPKSPDVVALNPSQNPKSPVEDKNIANNKAGNENLCVLEPQIPKVPKLGSLPSEQMRRHESFCQPNIKTPTCTDSLWDLRQGKGGWIHGNEIQDEINITGCVVPITPDPFVENGDFHLDSPLTVEVKQFKLDCDSQCNVVATTADLVEDNENGSPQTPEDSVFDPFAPGPGHLVRAPQCRKYLKSNISISRRLDFPGPIDASHDEDESLSDQEMFESLYEDLITVIVSKQQTEVTPHKVFPVFSARPDACPDAPIKVKSRDNQRNIDAALCKKLEF